MQAAGAVAAAVVGSSEADVVMRAPAGLGSASGARIPALLLPRSAGAALRAAADPARAAGVLLQAAVGDAASAEQAAMHAGGLPGGRGGRGVPLQARDLGCRSGVASEASDGSGSSDRLQPMTAPAQAEGREAPADGSGDAPIWEQCAGSKPEAGPGAAQPDRVPGPEAAAPGSPPAVPAAQGAAPSADGPQGSTPSVAGIEVELLLPPQTQAWLQAALGAQAQVGEALGALLEALSGAAMQAALVARQAQQAQHTAAGAAGLCAGCAGEESAGDSERGCVERGRAEETLVGGSEMPQEACSADCRE